MEETLVFSLKLAFIPIILKGTDGVERNYELRELDGRGRDEYLGSMNAKMKMTSSGKVEIQNFEGLHSNLLSRCLFDESGKSVSEDVIQTFPAKVQTKLFEKAQEISGMGKDEDEDEEGND